MGRPLFDSGSELLPRDFARFSRTNCQRRGIMGKQVHRVMVAASASLEVEE